MPTKAELQTALDIIGENLRREAIHRDWCPSYDEFVHDVNAEAGIEVLRLCEDGPTVPSLWVEGSVTFDFSYRVKFDGWTEHDPITRADVRSFVEKRFQDDVLRADSPLGRDMDRIRAVTIRRANDREQVQG